MLLCYCLGDLASRVTLGFLPPAVVQVTQKDNILALWGYGSRKPGPHCT